MFRLKQYFFNFFFYFFESFLILLRIFAVFHSRSLKMKHVCWVFLMCIGVTIHIAHSAISRQDYFQDRNEIINEEDDQSFGSDIKLTEKEQLANTIIMQAKLEEYRVGFVHPHLFNPSRHIFEILDAIKQSKLFQIIQKMPKGGILHAHDTGLCSTSYVVSLTYWPNLWQRASNNNNDILEFLFSRTKPPNVDNNSIWKLVKDARSEMGAKKYDEKIYNMFTLYRKNVNPLIQFQDANDVWSHFQGLFILFGPIVTFAPVWKAYYKRFLKEMLADGVQYLELRSTLPQVFFAHVISKNQRNFFSIVSTMISEHFFQIIPCKLN